MDIQELRNLGYSGFISVGDLLRANCAQAPDQAGTYVLVNTHHDGLVFLPENPGPSRTRKGRTSSPTKGDSYLVKRWVNGSCLMYVGKADVRQRRGEAIKTRLQEYLSFPMGQLGHWGGRLVWQIPDYDRLLVAWRVCADGETAEVVEKALIREHMERYKSKPFANLRL